MRSRSGVEPLPPRRLSFVGMSINDVWQAIQEEEPFLDWLPERWRYAHWPTGWRSTTDGKQWESGNQVRHLASLMHSRLSRCWAFLCLG